MTNYTAQAGQSIWDVCLNTYATLDLIVKLMQDNGFLNIDTAPYSGQVFAFDETLVADQNITAIATQNGTPYATAV